MYVIIMGGGRVGMTLASALIKANFDVTLIEKDQKFCNQAASELDALVICGNGTDLKTLEEANIAEADAFVAATGNDESNLLASILVKDYNLPKLIARISDPAHEEAFRKVGIDATVSPELTAAAYLEKLIIRPKIADMVILGKGNAELLDIPVENNKVIGKKIADISPTKNYAICAVYKGPEYKILMPEPGIILESGDKISILIKTKIIRSHNVFTHNNSSCVW
ncbi:MAG: TrkA family potassium uptake protein [Methanobacterium sp.]|nr:TrkA family potassium uptake protein [Methanobacterium sp.]